MVFFQVEIETLMSKSQTTIKAKIFIYEKYAIQSIFASMHSTQSKIPHS